jgi:alkylation response protein AidB-like acyl-CoA dehydrogenase
MSWPSTCWGHTRCLIVDRPTRCRAVDGTGGFFARGIHYWRRHRGNPAQPRGRTGSWLASRAGSYLKVSTISNSMHTLFREGVVAWFERRYQHIDPTVDDDRADILVRTPDGHHEFVKRSRDFLMLLAEAGFAGCSVPAEFGGRGLTKDHDRTVNEVMATFNTPSLRGVGIGPHLALPTILMAGTEDQKERYVNKIFSGEELWCQLFSEPDAGSDLVSLRCRATEHGDGFVVSGQKVWSSYAADAHFGLLLARTDPEAAKPHAGITMFILPMDSPGVTVRPLVDIGGGLHFNEVYLDEVFLERSLVLGGVNNGWQVANGTLGGERGGYVGGSGGGRRQRQILEAAALRPDTLRDASVRQRIVSVRDAARPLRGRPAVRWQPRGRLNDESCGWQP